MKTLQDQYNLIKEGKGHKGVFLNEVKRKFPNYVPNHSTFEHAADILKDKGIINENVIGLEAINNPLERKKESYEEKFDKFLEEARKKKDNDPNAEIKKTSQQVEDNLKKNFDSSDKKNPDNHIFGEIMKGYYCEMKDPKNVDKTEQQLRDIVLKNLAKDPIYYTKNGMFGEKGVGVEMDVPGLGEPKEAKGKHKSSGYGNLKEGIKRNYPNRIEGEYEGRPQQFSGDELYTLLVDTMFISSDVDDFIQKVTYALTDETSSLTPGNVEKLRNWWYKNQTNTEGEFENLEEQKFRQVVRTMVKQELIKENKKAQKTIKEIEAEAKLAEITTKMEAIERIIQEKTDRLTSIEENDDMKELMDKNALKELKKEIKVLEKYQGKCNKMYEKLTKKTGKKVVTDAPVEEAAAEDSEATAANMEKVATATKDAAAAAKELDDVLEEDYPEEGSKEYKEYEDAKDAAEERVDAGEDVESVIGDFPKFKDLLYQDLKGKFDGQDY